MQLIRYDAACRALQECAAIDEAKEIADKVEALKAYARQRQDTEMEAWLSEIRLRADRRIGELSRELDTLDPEESGSMAHGGLPTAGKTSKVSVLKEAGISTSRANRCEKLAAIPEELFEEYIDEKRHAKKPIKVTEVEAAITAKTREEKQRQELQAKSPIIPDGLYVGDFRDYAEQIPDESLELIFTDPPYDRDSIPLFEDLSEIAARVLRPGGSLIAYCGHIQLPYVLAGMSKHLRYWWVNACVHSGPASRMNKYGIKVTWKPMVWFVKGTRGDVQTMLDDSVSGGAEKSHHEWQQSQAEAEYYIEKLCSPGGIVWEPFTGGGTTIAACQSLGRKWIACEIDELAAAKIADRVA